MGIKLLRKTDNKEVEVASEQAAANLTKTGQYERIEARKAQASPTGQTARESQAEKLGPTWQKQIVCSADKDGPKRILEICVWPPRERLNTAVTIRESKRDGEKWTTSPKTYLPTGSQLLVLIEYLRQAWELAETLKQGQES